MPRGTDRVDEARIQGRLWTPALLGGNLGLWLDGKDISTISITTGVSEWRDKSGRGNHFEQGTSGDQPAYNAATGFVTFNGSNQYLSTSSIAYSSVFPGSAGTIAAVLMYTSGTVIFDWAVAGIGAARVGMLGSNRVDWSDDSAGQLTSWSADLSSTVKVLSVRKTGTDKTVRLDGTQVATHADTTTNSGSNAIGMGATNGASFFGAFTVAGWVFSATSDERRRDMIEGYLAWRYNYVNSLAASHPFKNRPPLIGD